MKLINKKNGKIYLEFKDDGEIIFCNDLIRDSFEVGGILIPPSLREKYDNQTKVFLNDPKFKEAFINIYYPCSMNADKYIWEL